MPAGHPLRHGEHRLLADLADQAGTAFRNARLSAELSGEVDRLALRTGELAESRRRLITAGDAERSRVERAISRQVIPYLAALPSPLEQLSRLNPNEHATLDAAPLMSLVESVDAAVAALRDITRGVFPAQLARSGLPIALGSLLARTDSTGRLVLDDFATGRRFDAAVEAAAYFCVAEVTSGLGDPVVVTLTVRDDQLRLVVRANGRGGLTLDQVRDRVEAAGGSVSIHSDSDCTVIDVRLHVPAGDQGTALDQTSSSRSGPNADLVT